MMRVFIILMWLISLNACSRKDKIGNNHIVKVETHAYSHTLYYSGTIQPLNTRVVPSPVEGVIMEMPFQYGEPAKSGQLLFQISSTKFLMEYKSALMLYIKAKNEFNNNQTLLNEAKFLHKNQLISDDDFKMKQSSYYNSRLTLLQTKDALENLLHQLNSKNNDPYNLTIADSDKITKIIHSRMDGENLRVLAPADGIVLSSGKGEHKKIMKGDVVKQGDVLAIIGDMNGVNVGIKVNELTVNQLRPGQKVSITGLAFPDDILRGEIQRIDRQGEVSGNGFPLFDVEISVPTLTTAQQQMIHVGMSAKVQIELHQASQILVPLTAVNEINGESFIKTWDEKEGHIHDVAIRTGKTTLDSIVVVSGLKQGECIVVPD